jgi:hypothetical protein
MTEAPGKWSPTRATQEINACARGDALTYTRTNHAKERMIERSLYVPDVLHVLKTGFVYREPEESTQSGYWKYQIEGTTPNSGMRSVRIVVIPDGKCHLKIVSVMWRDER